MRCRRFSRKDTQGRLAWQPKQYSRFQRTMALPGGGPGCWLRRKYQEFKKAQVVGRDGTFPAHAPLALRHDKTRMEDYS